MKTFFQFAEQAKKHRREKLNELAAGQPQQTPTTAAAPTATTNAAPAAAAPAVDYKTFGNNWAAFAKDPANAAALQTMGKTIPQLLQMPQIIAKMSAPAPAAKV